MKRILLGCLLSSAITLPAFAALTAGTPAPDFQTQASLAGKAFNYSLKEAASFIYRFTLYAILGFIKS